jgi:hypothetical protein
MDRNITNLLYDIQKLNRDIQKEPLNIRLIKFYQSRSNTLRNLINRIVDNQKNYPSYIKLNPKEQQQIELAYNLLNQIDLSLNIKPTQIITNKKNPFSFRSFIITISIFISIYLYYKIFIHS